MTYYKEVGSLLKDDRKYVDKIEKTGELEKIETEVDVGKHVYEIEYKLHLTPQAFENKSRSYVQKALRNHFGSWFALLNGGSRNIQIDRFNEDSCIAKIRYVGDAQIFD